MKINNNKIKEYLPFILMVLAIGTIAIFMNLDKGDDVFFKLVSSQNNLFQYLAIRYNQWTGRVVIESLLWLTSRVDLLFRILHPLMIGLLGISLYQLLPERKKGTSWLVVVLIALIPIELFISAGWITTNVHYIWVGAIGTFALIPLKKIYEKKNIAWYEYIIYLLAVLYASNNEQMFIALMLFYTLALVYWFIQERKLNWYIIGSQVIMVLNFINMLLAPGNGAREADEIASWFPTFGSLSLLEKFDLGLASSLFHYIFNSDLIYLVLVIFLVVGVFRNSSKLKDRLIAFIPLATSLLLGFILKAYALLSTWLDNQGSGEILRLLYRRFKESSLLYGKGFDISSIQSILTYALMFLVIGAVIYSIYIITGNRKETFFLAFILGVGLITRTMMGISPTIWISGVRTFMIFYIAIIYVILYIYQIIKKERKFD